MQKGASPLADWTVDRPATPAWSSNPGQDGPIAIEQHRATVLDLAAQPHVHLAVWTRPLPPALVPLQTLDSAAIDDLDFETTLDLLHAEVADGLVEAGYPDDPRRDALHDEICALAQRFAGIFALDAVAIRLEWIETDACRKFHADHVTARLLCTLLGAGTQWVYGGRIEGMPIRQLRAGNVGIFKGRLATDTPMVLHRSPPIAAAGEIRLLLAIDPPRTG